MIKVKERLKVNSAKPKHNSSLTMRRIREGYRCLFGDGHISSYAGVLPSTSGRDERFYSEDSTEAFHKEALRMASFLLWGTFGLQPFTSNEPSHGENGPGEVFQ